MIRDLYDGYCVLTLWFGLDMSFVFLVKISHTFNYTSQLHQIAGAYPDVDVETYLAVSSDPPADMGQWSYDFSDPEGPQMGTVALPGLSTIYQTEDPVAIIADHITLNVPLGHGITEPVDLVVLCDRSRKYFSERKFLILELEDKPGMVSIAAFNEKSEIPNNAKIHGQVTFVQIPWLPFMEKKKSGFEEEDQLY